MENSINDGTRDLLQELNSTERLVFTLEEAAEVLGISRSSAYNLASTKNDDGTPSIPGIFKIGGKWMVYKSKLKQFLEGIK